METEFGITQIDGEIITAAEWRSVKTGRPGAFPMIAAERRERSALFVSEICSMSVVQVVKGRIADSLA